MVNDPSVLSVEYDSKSQTPSSSPHLDISQWLDIGELCGSDDPIDAHPGSFTRRDAGAQLESPSPLPGSNNRRCRVVDNEHVLPRANPVPDRAGRPELSDSRISISYLTCFPSDPARPEGRKKKRRDFTESRRQEVAQIRKAGACLRCKIRKTPVSHPALQFCPRTTGD